MMRQLASPGVLLGAVLLSFAFGSIHAFAALMAPLEAALGASRADVSLGYSLAIASLTLGVFALPRFRQYSPAVLAFACGCVAGAGLALASAIQSTSVFLIGYGVVFGFANGVAYGLFLDRAAYAMPDSPGLSAGLVTAVYGLGAAVFAQVLAIASPYADAWLLLKGLAVCVALAALLAAGLFRGRMAPADPARAGVPLVVGRRLIAWLWVVYFLGASGGLMVIAHASGIVADAGLGDSAAGIAPTMVALGNIAGSLAGGPWGERRTVGTALAAPLVFGAIAMIMVLALPQAAVAALTLCGAAYGALISVVPAAIRKLAGAEQFPRTFGLVFTAWGVAGLSAPFVAGLMFDLYAGYALAIALAATAAGTGALLTAVGGRLAQA